MNADDLKKITDASQGFAGRFFFDAERGDLAFIAKDCDDRQCDCEEKLNSDGDQDCSVCIGDMDCGADTGEPIATLLNAVPSLLEEINGLLTVARSCPACGFEYSHDGQSFEENRRLRDQLANMKAALDRTLHRTLQIGGRVRLLRQIGSYPHGSIVCFVGVVPHGGNYDDAFQYVLADGTHIPESAAETYQ